MYKISSYYTTEYNENNNNMGYSGGYIWIVGGVGFVVGWGCGWGGGVITALNILNKNKENFEVRLPIG